MPHCPQKSHHNIQDHLQNTMTGILKGIKSLVTNLLTICTYKCFITIITTIIIISSSSSIIIIIILSTVRPLRCSNFTIPISFLDIPHFFYMWDYIDIRSLEFVIHPFLVTVLPNVSHSYKILASMEVTYSCRLISSLWGQSSPVQP